MRKKLSMVLMVLFIFSLSGCAKNKQQMGSNQESHKKKL